MKNSGVSRTKLYDSFIESVKRDIGKCLMFAVAFLDVWEIEEVVKSTLKPFKEDNE